MKAKTLNSTLTSVDYAGLDLDSMAASVNYTHWYLSHFTPFVGQKLVEVGAGAGSVSKFLLSEYQKPLWMVEPSQQVDKLKANLAGVTGFDPNHVLQGFLSDHADKLKQEGIDSIFYVNVLEHIENDEEELKQAYDILPTGGHVLTFSPAMPFLMSDFDRSIGHYRRYMLDEMKQKMQNAGFSLQKAFYMDFPGIIPWFIKYVMFKGKLDPADAKLYDSLVIPILSRFEPNKLLPLGKNILVVGKK